MRRKKVTMNVSNYKCLGTIIDDLNTEILCQKGQQRLYCLRKLARFHVNNTLIKKFVISFSVISWHGNLSIRDKNSPGQIIKVASRLAGIQFDSMVQIFNRQVHRKVLTIRPSPVCPLGPQKIDINSPLRLLPFKH